MSKKKEPVNQDKKKIPETKLSFGETVHKISNAGKAPKKVVSQFEIILLPH